MAHLGGIVEGNCKLKEQNQPQSETAQTSANTETGTIAFSQIVVETLVPPFPLRRTRLPIYSAVERSSYLWLRSTQCVPQCSTVCHTKVFASTIFLSSQIRVVHLFATTKTIRQFDFSLLRLIFSNIIWHFEKQFGKTQ